MLLLNSSNLSSSLTFPYAFVQVSEIARRFNIEVVYKDLFSLKKENLENYLKELLYGNKFNMIGLSLRNTDSCNYYDYFNLETNLPISDEGKELYFPIQDTKHTIDALRKITRIPIIIGGFGFSIMPERLMNYLKPDFGVFGGPEDVFKKVKSLLLRENLESIQNLLYFEGNELKTNPRVFFPPASKPEYTDSIILDIKNFILENKSNDVVDSIAIEISRGCAFNCNFCSEPIVKGNSVQYRNLESIRDDIERLGKFGLNKLFLICCEMNSLSNDFIISFAKKIKCINEKRTNENKVTWQATYLMKLTAEEQEILWEGGWRGGWYDIISLDDNNLTKIKAPYNSKTILNYVIKSKNITEKHLKRKGNRPETIQQRYYYSFKEKKFDRNVISLFLGNVCTDIQTLKKTIKIFDEKKLNDYFDYCSINKITRVYDYEKPDKDVIKNSHTISFSNEIVPYDEIYPSFSYPPLLLKDFKFKNKINEFFDYVSTTFFSCEYIYNQDWIQFLQSNVSSNEFYSIILEIVEFDKIISGIDEVNAFLNNLKKNKTLNFVEENFYTKNQNPSVLQLAIYLLLENYFLKESFNKKILMFLKKLNLATDVSDLFEMSPYKIMKKLLPRFESEKDLLDFIANLCKIKYQTISDIILFFKYLIYYKNISFSHELRILLL